MWGWAGGGRTITGSYNTFVIGACLPHVLLSCLRGRGGQCVQRWGEEGRADYLLYSSRSQQQENRRPDTWAAHTLSHKPKPLQLLQQGCKTTNAFTNEWLPDSAAAGAGGRDRPGKVCVLRQEERRQKGAELQGDPCTCKEEHTSSSLTWMRIFPKQTDGVLSSAMNMIPWK